MVGNLSRFRSLNQHSKSADLTLYDLCAILVVYAVEPINCWRENVLDSSHIG